MSDKLQKEKDFFHSVAPKIITEVKKYQNSSLTHTHKGGSPLNFVTEGDIAVEKLLVSEIQCLFPEDLIRGEELSSHEKINKGRVWLIDPICGTSNFVRGFNTFATEIALAQNNKLIAACVIDHNLQNYIWSIGGGSLFVNNRKIVYKKYPGVKIEVDMGTIPGLEPSRRKILARLTSRLMIETDYTLSSYTSSLNSVFVTLGKLDAYIAFIVDPLHFAGAIFLVQQSGGIVTDFSGRPWTLQSESAIMTHDKILHEEIVKFFKS